MITDQNAIPRRKTKQPILATIALQNLATNLQNEKN